MFERANELLKNPESCHNCQYGTFIDSYQDVTRIVHAAVLEEQFESDDSCYKSLCQ